MVVKGEFFVSSDVNAVNSAILSNNSKILVLSESDCGIYKNHNNVLGATILLPPYESICFLLNGDIANSSNIYYSYLSSKEPDSFLTAVFAALFKGQNIVLFVGPDEQNVGIIPILLEYLKNTFGIHITQNGTGYDDRFDYINLTKLYLNDYISVNDFLLLYPLNMNILEISLQKLMMDVNPFIEVRTVESCLNFFNEYKNRIKKADKFLVNPIAQTDCGGDNIAHLFR